MQGKRDRLVSRGEPFWGVPEGTFRQAWEDYQRGGTITEAVAFVNRRLPPWRKAMRRGAGGRPGRIPRVSLLAEWRALGLAPEVGAWNQLRGYQWARISTLSRAYRLPYWAIIYAALRAAERVEFDPLIELVAAGIPETQLLARRTWWASFLTEGPVERHPHSLRLAPGHRDLAPTQSALDHRGARELSRKTAGTMTPRGGRRGRHFNRPPKRRTK